jgi:hypothetical protein
MPKLSAGGGSIVETGLAAVGLRRPASSTRGRVRWRNSAAARLSVALLGTITVGWIAWSQEVSTVHRRISSPYDWSHRHLIFSQPTTLEDSVRIQGDVRYWHQRERRSTSRVFEAMEESDTSSDSSLSWDRRRRRRGHAMKRDWGEPLGVNATMGAGMFPAKFSFDLTTANCGNATTPDYVVFNTSLASTASQAGIVAFDNLYSGCPTGSIPTTYWAYETTATGDNCSTCVEVTSPVLSGDGSQVAFIGSSASGSFLYILKPKAGEGTVGAPVQPTTSTANASTYVTCRNLSGGAATSCLLSLALGSHSNTNSPPFYDYGFDTLYVGDDNGVLYKFTGIFLGTPAKVTTGGWPFTVHSGFKLTGPVYDQTSGNAYVGDSNGVLSFVRDTRSNVGACGSGSPPCLGANTLNAGAGNPIVDAPILDSTNKKVFVVVGRDAGGNAGVFQVHTDLSSSVEATIGPQFANIFYDGAFDNEYFTSIGTGHIYVCGNVSTISGLNVLQNLALFRIGFNSAGTMNGTKDAGSVNLTNGIIFFAGITQAPTCSPATEVSPSSSSDLLFLSVTGSGNQTGCGGNGCIMSFALPTSSPFTFPSAASHTLPASSGTSAIIVDNIATSPAGASQIYFTPLGNSSATFPCGSPNTNGVGCAIQASQAGLQ